MEWKIRKYYDYWIRIEEHNRGEGLGQHKNGTLKYWSTTEERRVRNWKNGMEGNGGEWRGMEGKGWEGKGREWNMVSEAMDKSTSSRGVQE